MTVRKVTAADGVVFASATGCRYVHFRVGDTHVVIVRRSNSLDTILNSYAKGIASRDVVADLRDGVLVRDRRAEVVERARAERAALHAKHPGLYGPNGEILGRG